MSGAVGGFVGTPGDLVNVRMQNDVKLPLEQRRKCEIIISIWCSSNFSWFCSYKHAIDGVIRVYREEGIRRLFSGASTATGRAILMTIGQLSFYDQIKLILLESGYFQDNPLTHFTASLSAVRVYNFALQF